MSFAGYPPYVTFSFAAVFGLTLVLDVTQQKTVYKDKIAITFASMWAPGEPMMKGYEKLFRRFEQEPPEYKVEPRWDGRWVLAALRPRLLTGTNIPDIVNTERDALIVLVKAGYVAALGEIIDRQAGPAGEAVETVRVAGEVGQGQDGDRLGFVAVHGRAMDLLKVRKRARYRDWAVAGGRGARSMPVRRPGRPIYFRASRRLNPASWGAS